MCCSRAAATWPQPPIACASIASISSRSNEVSIEKDRQRWRVLFRGTEFYINLDRLDHPDLGYFLEVKSRTWSRRDAEHKANVAEELLEFLGASHGERVTQDYLDLARALQPGPMTDALDFAIQLARQAGELLSGFLQAGELKPSLKDDNSLVTQADIEADRLIAAAIRQNFPDDLILSEELQPAYPFGLAAPDRAVWVVDPLDGTTNFHLGLPFWGVSIARLVAGWPDTAALYFPQIDELYSAQKGRAPGSTGSPCRCAATSSASSPSSPAAHVP